MYSSSLHKIIRAYRANPRSDTAFNIHDYLFLGMDTKEMYVIILKGNRLDRILYIVKFPHN